MLTEEIGNNSNTYSEGKISPGDEGDLEMQIGTDFKNKIVRIDFGKPVAWLGLSLSSSKSLVEVLKKHIEILEKM